MQITARAPAGSIILTLAESDGSTSDLDLSAHAALLVQWGMEDGETASEPATATVVLGELSADDEVVVIARDGAAMDLDEALGHLSAGIVVCLRRAVEGVAPAVGSAADAPDKG